MTGRRAGRVTAVLILAALGAACSSASTPTARSGTDSRGLGGSLTVSTASSLGPAFQEVLVQFTDDNPQASVELNVASSTALALQIEQGAQADVFASADTAAMDVLARGGHLHGASEPFARNRMTIVTKPGNPLRIRSVEDLQRADVVAECVETAPCGRYAARVLTRANVTIDEGTVTRELDAAATLGAVTNGDADAAIVYVTDARAANAKVTRVPISAENNVEAVYPIAVVAGTSERRLATAFVTFVQSPAGQAILARFGFLPAQ